MPKNQNFDVGSKVPDSPKIAFLWTNESDPLWDTLVPLRDPFPAQERVLVISLVVER